MSNPASKNEYHDDRMNRATQVYRALSIACDSRLGSGLEIVADDIVKSHAVPAVVTAYDELYPLDTVREFMEKVLEQNDPQTHAEIVAWEVLTWFNIPRIQRVASKN